MEAPSAAPMSKAVEQSVQNFYDTYGWVEGSDGTLGEDKAYRSFRPAYQSYSAGSQRRTLEAVARSGHILFAGCGDMPAGHIAIAESFQTITCIDISRRALDRARTALGRPTETILGSILDLSVPDATFDVVFCAHVLYHINGDDQERAVRQLIRVTKPGGRVVFLYFNPASPFRMAGGVISRIQDLAERLKRRTKAEDAPSLYFCAHPLSWWARFGDICRLSLHPWEVVGSRVERLLIWNDGIARLFYRAASILEVHAPRVAARLWMFPMIILEK